MGSRRRLLCVALLLVPGSVSGDDAPPGPGAPPAEERLHLGFPPAEFRVERDPDTGAKVLVRADGRRFASAGDAVASSLAGLSPVRRAVDPSLWPLLDEPARAAERVRVLLVLRRQPVHEASLAVRARARADLAPRMAALRRPLAAVAPLRLREPGRRVQLGDVLEEEARLLAPADRAGARRLRVEVRDRVRAMRREILDAARPVAAADQAPVVAHLAGIPGVRVLGTTLLVSAVAAEVPAGRIADLVGDLPSVAGVWRDAEARLSLDTSVPTVGAASWTGAGYDGAGGTRVGVLDTGIDETHPALSGAVVGASVHCGTYDDPSFYSVDDFAGHGSHVAGIVGSRDGTRTGVAPGVEFLNAKCFAYYSSWDFWIWQAADWALDNGADVLNGSFGYKGRVGESTSRGFFDAVVDDLGISVACSGGNGGIYETFYTPADGFNVVGVAALYDEGTGDPDDDTFGQYSSTGPAVDGRRKPDLTAPGSGISSCAHSWEGEGADWVEMSGTSMAAPHVAGALALLHDYGASWRPEAMKALLLATTRNGGTVPADWDRRWGFGALDLAAAFEHRATLIEETFTTSGASRANYAAPALKAGSRVALCWNRRLFSNGASSPTSYRPPMDLDLLVFDGDDGSLVASSARYLDTVERVVIPRDVEHPVISVLRAGTFPEGQSEVEWALATDAGTAAEPTEFAVPELSCGLSASKGIVREGEEFAVHAVVTNGSAAAAEGATATLSLPAGYVVVTGDNPWTFETIDAGGGARKATWIVRAAGAPETGGTGGPERILGVRALVASFGETMAVDAEPFRQVYDGDLPRVSLSPASGLEATSSSALDLAVSATDDTTEVVEMRFRNPGSYWLEWRPLEATVAWVLQGGPDAGSVECQVRDAAGNESLVHTAVIPMDTAPPTGGFVLCGGEAYLLPDRPLVADLAGADASGTGIRGFRWRSQGAGEWSEWIPGPGSGPALLPRPGGESTFAVEGQFRDAADNLSAPAKDSIRVLAGELPSVTGARSWRGVLSHLQDVDAMRLDLLAGDVLDVRVDVRAPRRIGMELALDLRDPAGERVLQRLYPQEGWKLGIRKLAVERSGEYILVLRIVEGYDGYAIPCTASFKVARPRDTLRVRGSGVPAASGNGLITFQAMGGMTLSGWVEGDVLQPPTLVSPEGAKAAVAFGQAEGLRRPLQPTILAGGTGTWRLLVPANGSVTWDLRLRTGKPRRLVESEE